MRIYNWLNFKLDENTEKQDGLKIYKWEQVFTTAAIALARMAATGLLQWGRDWTRRWESEVQRLQRIPICSQVIEQCLLSESISSEGVGFPSCPESNPIWQLCILIIPPQVEILNSRSESTIALNKIFSNLCCITASSQRVSEFGLMTQTLWFLTFCALNF